MDIKIAFYFKYMYCDPWIFDMYEKPVFGIIILKFHDFFWLNNNFF